MQSGTPLMGWQLLAAWKPQIGPESLRSAEAAPPGPRGQPTTLFDSVHLALPQHLKREARYGQRDRWPRRTSQSVLDVPRGRLGGAQRVNETLRGKSGRIESVENRTESAKLADLMHGYHAIQAHLNSDILDAIDCGSGRFVHVRQKHLESSCSCVVSGGFTLPGEHRLAQRQRKRHRGGDCLHDVRPVECVAPIHETNAAMIPKLGPSAEPGLLFVLSDKR